MKKIAWNELAQLAIRDDYFSSLIGPEMDADKAEVREWQERTRVYKALEELKRKGEDLKLEKAIEPLREVYARVNPSRRSIFIAQVIYLLTK